MHSSTYLFLMLTFLIFITIQFNKDVRQYRADNAKLRYIHAELYRNENINHKPLKGLLKLCQEGQKK